MHLPGFGPDVLCIRFLQEVLEETMQQLQAFVPKPGEVSMQDSLYFGTHFLLL